MPYIRLDRFATAPGHQGTQQAPGPTPLAGVRALLRARAFGLFPALLPALLFLPVVLAPPLNHDVAAVLSFSQRWLAGEHLYSDLIDVNPPLIFVLTLLPAAFAAWTPLDGVQAVQLCVLGFGAFAWFLSVRVRDRDRERPAERVFLDVLPCLFLLAAGYDFGQREHLMAVGALPYVLCAARRAAGEKPLGRYGAAILAAVAFALKPHFLAVPGLVELAVIAGRMPPGRFWGGLRLGVRRWLHDRTPRVMAAVWALYLASLPLLFPDYLGSVVPLVWGYYLDLGGLAMWQVALVPRMARALCLFAPLLVLALRRPAGLASGMPFLGGAAWLPRMLGLAGLGAFASALAQHKGWSYHVLPVELFACALAAVLACRALNRAGASRLPLRPNLIAAIFTGLFALYAIASGEAPWKQIEYRGSQAAGLTALLKQHAAGERVLVLSPGIYPVFPALNYAGAQLTLRTMNLWLLQGAYDSCLPDGRRYREVWEMGRPEFFVYRTVAEDFAKTMPAAVVVDKQPGISWCGEEFDFIAYFSRHPLFAEVWSHYRLAADWDRYRLYIRKD